MTGNFAEKFRGYNGGSSNSLLPDVVETGKPTDSRAPAFTIFYKQNELLETEICLRSINYGPHEHSNGK